MITRPWTDPRRSLTSTERMVMKRYQILGQRELEFSGVKAQVGGGADEPFMSKIGTLLPMAILRADLPPTERAISVERSTSLRILTDLS
jgi:hypothetical protein